MKKAHCFSYVAQLLKVKDFTFKCQPFEKTVQTATEDDLVYCDSPYVDRHVDYYSGWDSERERVLFNVLDKKNCRFILSTRHHNDFRKNEYVESLRSKFNVYTRERFYHVGGSGKNRNPMVEAIVTNYDALICTAQEQEKQDQPALLENQATYSC